MASRSGVNHGLLVALLAIVVTIVLALIGAAVGARFIDQLSGVTLPCPAGKAAQNVPQQGSTTILSVSGILALLFPFIGGARGARVGQERPYPQEGTAKIWIEGPDTSSLGSIIPLSNKALRSRERPCS